MRKKFRTSTALVAGLSLAMGHVPVAAFAQTSGCIAGEDEAACVARQLQEAAAADAAQQRAAQQAAEQEAARQAAEQAVAQAAADEAARLAAEQAAAQAAADEAARLAVEEAAAQAATDEAARQAAEQAAAQAAADEAARLAIEEAAAQAATDEAARLAAEQAAAQAAADEAAPVDTVTTDAPAVEAAPTEDADALAAALASAAAPEAETDAVGTPVAETPVLGTPAAEAPVTEAPAAGAPDSEAPVAEAPALDVETPTDADALAAALAAASAAEDGAIAAEVAPTDTAPETRAPTEEAVSEPSPIVSAAPVVTEAAGADVAAALAAAAAADALVSDPEELSPEDETVLRAAQETADAAELVAEVPVDPVAEAEEQIAIAEAEAEASQQSLALLPEGTPLIAAVEEIITEDTARRPDEDFGSLLTARTDTARSSSRTTRDRTGLTGAQGLLLGGLAGLAVGSIIAGNRQVVNRAEDRLVVLRPQGDYQVIRDDDTLLRRPGNAVTTETFADGSSRNIINQPDGTQVITVRDRDLRILRRTVVSPDGRRTVLIDDIAVSRPIVPSELPPTRSAPAFVEFGTASATAALARVLGTSSVSDRAFSLAQIRSIRSVRDLAPAINLESVTFASGSAAISPDQATQLLALGRFMADAIAANPREIFLVEGHTDATGSASFNLGLSDRRAETVALALTEFFNVPPQNIVIQGYGEEFLLVPTLENEQRNRRVAVRRITDLLQVAAAN